MNPEPPVTATGGDEPGSVLSSDRELLAKPARQSPVAVIFIAWRFIRNLGMVNLGIAALFLFSGRLDGALLFVGLGAAVVGAAFMTLAWWRFVFLVDGDQLLVTKGVLAEERLTIPLDRVQSVSIDQKFLHRPIGLVSAKVDTAGSADTEFEIDAIDRDRAEALQRLVAGYRQAGAARVRAAGTDLDDAETGPVIEDQETVLVERSLFDLVRIGITRWPWAGLVALAPLFAVLDDLGDLIPFDIEVGERLGDNLPEFGPRLIGWLAVLILAFAILAGLVGALLQTIREVVTNWDLKLWQSSTGFRRTAGLLSKTSKASTFTRIQSMVTDQTPAQRWLGIRKLSLPTIGEGDLDVPGATDAEVNELRRIVFGSSEAPPLNHVVSPLAVFLATRNMALLAVPLTVVMYFTLSWWTLLILLAVPIQWVVARKQWAVRRWGVTPDRIAESYGVVSRHTAEFELIKAQTVSVTQSLFERRRGLATVRLGAAEGHLTVPLIGLAEANAVRDRILYEVESNNRPFM